MEDLDLDINWVNEFVESEAAYDDFYEQPQQVIDCYILAIDINNNLFNISKTKINISSEIITGDTISLVFNKNRLPTQQLVEIMLFNIVVSPDDIIALKFDKENTSIYSPGCDIPINPSPKSLHKVNAIFLLGRERERSNRTVTKKVRITLANKTRRKFSVK